MVIVSIFDKIKKENRTALLEHEAKQVLREIGVQVPALKVVNSLEEAIQAGNEIGYPVVMKLMSPQVLHKTDYGAVVIGLKDQQEVERTFQEFMKKFENVDIHGVLIEKMVKSGLELIVGTNIDANFGPVILFGVGGVLVEALKDVVFRMCPISKEQALSAIEEIKAKVLLEGYRGFPIVNKDELAELMVKISNLAWENRNHIAEMDINPIIANEDGIFPVDARIILRD
jgi:acetyl-CoA synthetase (ADP-forming)